MVRLIAVERIRVFNAVFESSCSEFSNKIKFMKIVRVDKQNEEKNY